MIPDIAPLNLFYAEPDPDRWLPYDRYPRRVVRRLVRGRPRPGGQKRVFLNLCAGLRKLGVPYRVNDYRHARRHPHEPVCIVGKPCVLDGHRWENPLLFGASVFSHPLADPDLLDRLPVRRVLVPGEWMRRMFEPWYGPAVHAWPVGIDADEWRPAPGVEKDVDVLVYDKLYWTRERHERDLLTPVRAALAKRKLRTATIRYGSYREEDFRALVARSRSMLFLCEHETQGIAYQQVLASGVPILAWNGADEWHDPEYFPDRVRFGPVTAVPYWDDRCGERFRSAADLDAVLDRFVTRLDAGEFAPREFILDGLTLEHCAAQYVEHVSAVAANAN